ncbi:MAG: NAD(P)-binding protein [Proteobacteria bacterium]|nr:NAD(P)-binding protein [Pseudomonadota bacterium]
MPETIIVGGGISGLACARQLHDAGRSFLILTEDIGGRVRSSANGSTNLGAYYVTRDYEHVGSFIDRGRRIRRSEIQRGNHDGSLTRGDAQLLLHPVESVRFLLLMGRFRRRYAEFKRRCAVISQAQAIRDDPVLNELYRTPALEYLEAQHIEHIARSYIAPVVQGTAFTSIGDLTAMTLLVGILPTIVPMYEFTLRTDLLTAGFEDSVVLDSVADISSSDGDHTVRTVGGATYVAPNVVVAAPTHVSAALLGLTSFKRPVSAHIFLIEGELLRPWSDATFTLFPEGEDSLAIAQQPDGLTVFGSKLDEPGLSRYFASWTIREHHHWDPAFHLLGDVLLDCEQGRGRYLVGDHNVSNLEDSYITGMYAASRIISG